MRAAMPRQMLTLPKATVRQALLRLRLKNK
jgi:hypothetical protein